MIGLIESHYPKTSSKGGHPQYRLKTMLRIYLMQQWYARSDPGMEGELIEVPKVRRFTGIDLMSAGSLKRRRSCRFSDVRPRDRWRWQ